MIARGCTRVCYRTTTRQWAYKEKRTIHHTVIDRTELLWSEPVPNISAEVATRLEVRSKEDQKP